MAICKACDQEMTENVACTQVTSDDFPDGVERARIPYTKELGYPAHCVDCSTPRGQLHHPGCDAERCPRCGGQAISCECPSSSEEP